jgi:hypothetical protein
MANHMNTSLTIGNLDKPSYDKLKEIFNDGTNEYYTNVEHIIKQMYGDVDFSKLTWWYANIGAKWLEVESAVTDEFESEVQIYMTSAWDLPTQFLEKLTYILCGINKDVVLYGTYEDESLEPMGAFVFAFGYEDVEDLDIEVDWDKYWGEDDDETDEYRHSVIVELMEHKNSLYQAYLEVLEDRKQEEQ